MKKFIPLALFLLSESLVFGQGTVTIPSISLTTTVNSLITVPISVQGISVQDTITAYSFDIAFPSALEVENVSLDNTLTPSTGTNAYLKAVNSNNSSILRVAVAGATPTIQLQNGMTSGTLINLVFKVNGSVSNGTISFTQVDPNTTPNGFIFNAGTVPTTLVNGTVDITTDAKENNNPLPKSFALRQNYPNPFNPTTKIQYDLPTSSFVTLKIFNTLGQEVKTLVNQKIEAGYHSVLWNGLDNKNKMVSSGVYIYKIQTDSFSNVKKAIFIK
ncbi:T9SS type A sorting domain-containing protein [bacterium]|nr:T9SS type A sorting domain-containing protein [bacterium]